ncbi:arginase family protein [Intrasporangium sp. YIM S08009]|uniref:arginase family protein n=1 Tax=Intrasporangium zincisolvens TaxID=3080018 RepID=UPI002B0554EE|nr:arginase family protein [Intrasporangium sp. YIM S08009]
MSETEAPNLAQGRPATSGSHLRLLWPQWQGAGSDSVRRLAPEFPFDVARRGYAVGTAVLQAVLPAHVGPTVEVPVHPGDTGLEEVDGIEAKAVLLEQLRAALALLREHDPARVTTLGGECSVSLAPFSHLLGRYGQDLAILWVDSHPDMGTGRTAYSGFHAMVISELTGHGDAEVQSLLPATTDASRVALVGMHDWTDATLPPVAAEWGLSVFAPDALRTSSEGLLRWLAGTGATKVAIHFDVDTIDADEVQLGLGADRGGLTLAQARRVVADVSTAYEVVGLTIAEFVPRQAMHLQHLLAGFPLLDETPQA